MKLFDSHCHLDDEKFNIDREELIESIFKEGIEKLITAGYSLRRFKRSVRDSKQLSTEYIQHVEYRQTILKKMWKI